MIHKEGYKTILIATVVLLLFYVGAYVLYSVQSIVSVSLAVVSTAVWFFIIQFFRNPRVNIPKQGNIILSPANGKVVVIERISHQSKVWIQISIFMSPLDVHVNRSPIKGIVKKVEYFAGRHIPAWKPKASLENERTYIEIQNKQIEIAVKQIAGAMARRIVCYLKQNDVLDAGQEIGFIKFGSRVDVLIPPQAQVQVTLDTHVIAGESILATYD
ncbi:MAG: phosphatidylserine decarboxylase family protein [Bacteroidia bacterium]|nr:phosphatidylserine decarboxylase family protein [Bacteroidia bacterium]MDW8346793.1 phosphatidylserine decarboxylase family protein [Bacteroidia bacterium]